MYRHASYLGGPVMNSAISGVEQALWDILGTSLGVPVHQLLGGAARDKIRVYTDDPPWRDELIVNPVVIKDGWAKVPTEPGLGTDLVDDVCRAHPAKSLHLPVLWHDDGSVADWWAEPSAISFQQSASCSESGMR